jgi:hypothetical protein
VTRTELEKRAWELSDPELRMTVDGQRAILMSSSRGTVLSPLRCMDEKTLRRMARLELSPRLSLPPGTRRG